MDGIKFLRQIGKVFYGPPRGQSAAMNHPPRASNLFLIPIFFADSRRGRNCSERRPGQGQTGPDGGQRSGYRGHRGRDVSLTSADVSTGVTLSL